MTRFDPGQLDRRVQILRAAVTDDGLQRRAGVHAPWGGPRWAARRDVADSERFAAGTDRAAVETRFQMRWSSDIAGLSTDDRLSCEGLVYQIVGVKEIGRRHLVEVSTRRMAR